MQGKRRGDEAKKRKWMDCKEECMLMIKVSKAETEERSK